MALARFEAVFLHHTSFVDTTAVMTVEDKMLQQALDDQDRDHGALAPFLRQRIKDAVNQHNALTEAQRQKILED